MADTQLQQLVINELTKAQYEAITPEPNQLYMVTDEDYLEPSDIATSITAASTNAQVAGAKAVYDAIQAGGSSDPNAVHYTAETKTTEEKAQARNNIGAGTYSKPDGGIPASDIASGVIPDVSGKEDTSNKVTSMTSASTDTQYPSAKAVYNALQNAGNPIVNNSVENHGLGWKVNAINFTWDKVVPTGAPTITFSGTTYYLISELAPSKDSFTYSWQDGYYDVNPKDGVSVYRSNSSGDPEIATPLVTFDEKLLLDADGAFMIATVPGTFTIEEESITIPKAGIWAKNGVYTFHSLTAPETYSTIDPNFIPAGSTDNPILTNAIETNGIGWKESALEEAYIEWEGDTEGRASIDDYYQVYSGVVNHIDFIGGTVANSEGAEEVIEQDYLYYDDLYSGVWYISNEYDYCTILEKDITIDDQLYHSGIYFYHDGDIFTNYIDWVSQDTYNKINVDYLPDGGIGYVENSLAGEVWYGDTDLSSHHSLSDQFITILNNSYKKVGSATPLSQILVNDYGIVTTNDGEYLIGDGSETRYFVIRNQTHIAYSIYDSLPGAGKIAIIVVQNPGEYYIDDSLVYTFTKEQIGIWMVNSANLQGLRWGTNNNIAKIKKIDATYLPIIPYTKSEIDDKVSTLNTAIQGKANTSHKHPPIDCSIGYGGCATAIDTAAKVVSNLSGYSLNKGSIVCIHFQYGLKSGTSAQTLNINNTGAEPITYSGVSTGASGSLYDIPVYSWVTFMYDGSNFEIITWNNRKALTKNALTFTTSGGASAGTTFDGSAAKTISYATVGAAASSHSHAFADLTSRPSYAGATMTGSTAIPEVKTATWDGKSVVSGVASGGNWTSITINGTTNSIPAGGSGGTTKYLHSIVLTDAHSNGTQCISFTILNTTSTAYTTIAGIADALTASKKYACTGYTHGASFEVDCMTYEFNLIPVYLLKDGSALSIHAYTSDASDDGCGRSVEWTWSITDWTVSDTVM